MSSKFFNNEQKTLFEKFTGILEAMNVHDFCAVVGYFRSSGYFKLQPHLKKVQQIKILAGINVDKRFEEAQRKGLMFLENPEQTKAEFLEKFREDIAQARYSQAVEQGILDFIEDLAAGKIEVRAHPSKTIHAKFYLLLPDNYPEDSNGWVIMGSSNLTEAGLGTKQPPNYELNVALKDHPDVAFVKKEFDRLWDEGTPILSGEIQAKQKETHLQIFTPFEIYMKLLMEYFGEHVEPRPDLVDEPPKPFKKLHYQVDAANEGFQMLKEHDGFFLADVVGLGKTVVACMIAQRFLRENGSAKILVVHPPPLQHNWVDTFRRFKIEKDTQFITHDSLHKILERKDARYWSKEDYDLVLVDEAHKYRNATTGKFKQLQELCKAPRSHQGLIGGRKKVILISATPLNNHPQDLYHQLLLFQDARRSTLPQTNLEFFFAKKNRAYDDLKKEESSHEKVRELYKEIREKVIAPVTVRRTRRDLQSYPKYLEDLQKQGIRFPEFAPLEPIRYELAPHLSDLFEQTVEYLTDSHHIQYFRYQAIAYLKEAQRKDYPRAVSDSKNLAGIMKTLLIKRLESSFPAFKKTLETIQSSTESMIAMFERDRVIIAPDLKINEEIKKGLDMAEIEERVRAKQEQNPSNQILPASHFEPEFLQGLKKDAALLHELQALWSQVNEDPKLDEFKKALTDRFFQKEINPSGKLVVFTESKDTANYLADSLKNFSSKGVVKVSAENRSQEFKTIQENFDANYSAKKQKDDVQILISTDVFSEGVNLHRANLMVNYDTPWNATQLIQRAGRLNRIGGTANTLHTYHFYPSKQGDAQINLYQTALRKLQGIHSAFGEDSQIFSKEELVEEFELFRKGELEEPDHRLKYLQIIREFKAAHPEDFERIQKFPLKAKTIRSNEFAKHSAQNSSVVFLRSERDNKFYQVTTDQPAKPLDFLGAADLLEAKPTEKAQKVPKAHYKHVEKALNKFKADVQKEAQQEDLSVQTGSKSPLALKFLRSLKNTQDPDLKQAVDILLKDIAQGRHTNLPKELNDLKKRSDQKTITSQQIQQKVLKLAQRYTPANIEEAQDPKDIAPHIVLCETFGEG